MNENQIINYGNVEEILSDMNGQLEDIKNSMKYIADFFKRCNFNNGKLIINIDRESKTFEEQLPENISNDSNNDKMIN